MAQEFNWSTNGIGFDQAECERILEAHSYGNLRRVESEGGGHYGLPLRVDWYVDGPVRGAATGQPVTHQRAEKALNGILKDTMLRLLLNN